MKLFKKVLREKKLGYFNFLIPILEFFYFFIKFKLDTRSTNKFLRMHWRDKAKARIPLSLIKEIKIQDSPFFIYNPTLILLNEKLTCFARVSNLSHKPITNFWERNIDQKFEKQLLNGIVTFDLNELLEPEKFKTIIEPHMVPNFEDPRAFLLDGKLVLFVNYIKKYPSKFSRKLISQFGFIEMENGLFTSIVSPRGRDIEKNWTPFKFENNQIYFIYESTPLVTLEYHIELKTSITKILADKLDFNFHGGSQFIRISPNEYLRIARYKFRFPKKGLVQISFALIHDENLNVKFVSSPFIFQKFGFETCNGLAIKDDTLFFSWGEDDEKMFIGFIKLSVFLDWIYSKETSLKSSFSVYKDN